MCDRWAKDRIPPLQAAWSKLAACGPWSGGGGVRSGGRHVALARLAEADGEKLDFSTVELAAGPKRTGGGDG